MKKHKKTNDAGKLFKAYFFVIFSILLPCVLICAVNISSDNAQYQLTGEKHDRITFDEISEYFF